MKRLTPSLLAVAVSGLGGCGFTASIYSQEDPAWTPKKEDLVAIIPAEHSTISDRQMLPIVRQQAAALGFSIVDPGQSQWMIVVGQRTNSTDVGFSTSFVWGGTITKKVTETSSIVQLSAYPGPVTSTTVKDDIWRGIVAVSPDQLKERPKTVVRALVEKFGTNFDDDVKLPLRKEEQY